MNKVLVVPIACIPLLREQRTHYGNNLTSQYADELWRTYRGIQPYLPSGGRVLDIGCGMAGIDVFLAHHYGEAAQITLADKQGISPKINAGFHADAETFSHYHDFDAALSLLKANGVKTVSCVDLNIKPFPDDEFDVVISLLSWGFHYPISTYSPRVAPGGIIVVDVRRDTDGEELLKRYGELVTVHEAKKYRRVVVQC